MDTLLRLSHGIDAMSRFIGKFIIWLVLAAAVISAANAVARKAFSIGSNAFLEIQWYLFAAVFLLCSPYTLQKNEHVRIDVLSGKLSPRGLAVIDIIGTLFFLLPMVVVVIGLFESGGGVQCHGQFALAHKVEVAHHDEFQGHIRGLLAPLVRLPSEAG